MVYREYMSSLSLFERKRYHCAMQKIIPGEHINSFMIQHYFQARHISWTSVFHGIENLQAGFDYALKVRDVNQEPGEQEECWKDVTKFHLTRQRATERPTLSPTVLV